MARSRAARTSRRQIAAVFLVLLALLGGTVSRLVHQLAVPHRLCRVHGTIEHGRDVDTLAAGAPAGAGVSDASRYRSDSVRHEPCELAPFTRTESALVLAAPCSVVAPLVSCGTVFLPALPPPRSAVYLEAPSRSPPA